MVLSIVISLFLFSSTFAIPRPPYSPKLRYRVARPYPTPAYVRSQTEAPTYERPLPKTQAYYVARAYPTPAYPGSKVYRTVSYPEPVEPAYPEYPDEKSQESSYSTGQERWRQKPEDPVYSARRRPEEKPAESELAYSRSEQTKPEEPFARQQRPRQKPEASPYPARQERRQQIPERQQRPNRQKPKEVSHAARQQRPRQEPEEGSYPAQQQRPSSRQNPKVVAYSSRQQRPRAKPEDVSYPAQQQRPRQQPEESFYVTRQQRPVQKTEPEYAARQQRPQQKADKVSRQSTVAPVQEKPSRTKPSESNLASRPSRKGPQKTSDFNTQLIQEFRRGQPRYSAPIRYEKRPLQKTAQGPYIAPPSYQPYNGKSDLFPQLGYPREYLGEPIFQDSPYDKQPTYALAVYDDEQPDVYSDPSALALAPLPYSSDSSYRAPAVYEEVPSEYPLSALYPRSYPSRSIYEAEPEFPISRQSRYRKYPVEQRYRRRSRFISRLPYPPEPSYPGERVFASQSGLAVPYQPYGYVSRFTRSRSSLPRHQFSAKA